MSWNKIEINKVNVRDIQEQADVIWSAFGSPKRFALFCTRTVKFPTIVYFSPLASDLCHSIIKRYGGVECPMPAKEEVAFLLGHDEDRFLLLYGN